MPPLPHLTLRGLPSKEKPPPLVKLIPVMAPYDMGEAPVLGGAPAWGLEERVDRVGTG